MNTPGEARVGTAALDATGKGALPDGCVQRGSAGRASYPRTRWLARNRKYIGGTMLLAVLSFRFFERPFLNLKRYFEYGSIP